MGEKEKQGNSEGDMAGTLGVRNAPFLSATSAIMTLLDGLGHLFPFAHRRPAKWYGP